MKIKQIFLDYLSEIRNVYQSKLSTDELSYRTPLENLLKQMVSAKNLETEVINEAKKIWAGRPDFTICESGLPMGYLEAEAYNCDLDHLKGHARAQNQRFSQNLDNFILTNHLEFRLYKEGYLQKSAKLPTPPEKGKIQIPETDMEMLVDLLEEFLVGELPQIRNPKDLAGHLARRTRQMKAQISRALTEDARDECEIGQNYRAFKDTLIPNLTPERFADMYSQTITYGLFAARTAHPEERNFTRLSAARLVPKTNPFLRKLFQQIAAFDLDERLAWIADDVAQLLAKAPINDIITHFNKGARQDDPIVHFYETFLSVYDPTIREKRGVYYTPQPVVNYIVRSLDHLLKTRFQMPLGLADEKAVILDPATGTGSFLYAMINVIYETVATNFGKGAWSAYVQDKLLSRIFGFELLMAPYAVAHLKLGLQLQETGDNFGSHQRLGIYLTNTLEEAITRADLLMAKYISDEANEAASIKRDKPILIVVGNPPYSGISANRSEYTRYVPPGEEYESKSGKKVKAGKNGAYEHKKTFIGRLIEDYKRINGTPLNERKHWLQDDYVKFIRFAQWRIDRTEEGLIGYITNHGYLDNPTFRAMRYNLMQSFDEIYVYNLHGNSRKKEKTPDGGKDENVFEIQQGVAILFCVKKAEHSEALATVYHADLWGLQKEKYETLLDSDIQSTEWQELNPTLPFYMFIPQEKELKEEYNSGWKITDIFLENSVGFVTARDNLTIQFTEKEMWKIVKDFVNLDEETARWKYKLRKDVRDWKVKTAQEDLRNSGMVKEKIVPVQYRPFDIRYTYYTGNSRGFFASPCNPIMRHLLKKNNIALIVGRTGAAIGDDEWNIVGISDKIVDFNLYRRGGGQVHPLYLYPKESQQLTNGLIESERIPNFSQNFLKALSEKLNLQQSGKYKLPNGITPEDIFHYAYAIFHSPTYRQRYGDFLKVDFPRLPLTSDVELFRDLAALGKELVAFHVLNVTDAPELSVPQNPFPIEGNNQVVSREIRFVEKEETEPSESDEIWRGKVYINKTQYFDNVPEDVWEFRIGGYPVCHKWLKDRNKRKLNLTDIYHYQKVIIALQNTIRLMEAIDERIPGVPIQ